MITLLRWTPAADSTRCLVALTVVITFAGCARKSASPPAPAANSSSKQADPGPESGTSTNEVAAAAGAAAPIVIEPEVQPFRPEDGFWMLKLADFDHFPADATTWSEQHGVLVCSGQPKGYAYTREDFENFTLRCEFRFVPKGAPPDAEAANKFNTGFMLCIQEPHKVWPASLEVQGRFDEMASIKSNGGVPALKTVDDQTAREAARLPVGQWNAIEIVAHDGAISATLNGLVICTGYAGELKSGKLGLQSEGFDVHFRHLRLRLDN